MRNDCGHAARALTDSINVLVQGTAETVITELSFLAHDAISTPDEFDALVEKDR